MDERTDGSMSEREKEQILHQLHVHSTPATGHSLGTFDLVCTCLGRPAINILMHLQNCSVTDGIAKHGLVDQLDGPSRRFLGVQASQTESVTGTASDLQGC
jgi:hypothetical protein